MVDTYSTHAFGFLHIARQPVAIFSLLHNDVLPFYLEVALPVQATLTDNGREFVGREDHSYQLYLDLNGIEHRRTKVNRPQTNGFVEQLHKTALDEFFRIPFRQTFYESVDAFQADFDAWLDHYNRERPHLGYRNQGQTPWRTIRQFLPVTEELSS